MFARNGITGLAVILGNASGGLACRDYDDADAYHRWAADHRDLASTLPTVQTSRGYHVYFAGPNGYGAFDDGEYRANAGHYCVLPPSRHPDGVQYRWLTPLPTGELRFIDPAKVWLLPNGNGTRKQLAPPPGSVCDDIQSTQRTGNRRPPPPYPGYVPHEPVVLIPLTHTQAHPVHTKAHPHPQLHVSDDRIEVAIHATLPTGPGQRNHKLWELARRLKALMSTATMDELEPIVRQWHTRALPSITTTDWLESWIDFRTAWPKVKRPVGATMFKIMNTAMAQTPEDADAITKLKMVCRAMQEHHGPGRAWPLSCRMAASVVGKGRDTAARILKMLCSEGTIELVTPAGSKASRKAAEYRYCGGDR